MKVLKRDRKLESQADFVEHAAHRSRLARIGNALAAQYLAALTALTILVVLLLLGTDHLLIQFLFVAVVLLIPWHHSAAIVFFLIQASLFIHEGAIGLAKINYNPIVVSIIALIFVACADRFRTVWRMFGDGSTSGLWNAFLSLSGQSSATPVRSEDEEISAGKMIGRFLRLAAASTVAVVIALLVLSAIAENPDAKSEIRLAAHELRAISLAVFVLLVGVVSYHLTSAIFWRSLSRHQARVYLRSMVNVWLRPEARAIVARRIARKKR